MSYEGKNIVKNSVTLNEVTKANADALPNRDGKLLNVDGDLFKDNGTSLDKIVTHDAKSSKWGFVATTRRTVTDWTVTGTAAVGTSSLQGEPNVDSFQIDLTGAGDTASIIAVAPNSAVDARSNLVTINYLLYNQTEAVRATFLDWDGNQVGVMDLPATGSGVATTDNLRWAYKSTDIMLPKVHGNTDNEITVKFTSTSGIDVGTFYVNNIQFDSNAGVSGEWVESYTTELKGATNGTGSPRNPEFSVTETNGIYKIDSDTDGTYLEVLRSAFFDFSAWIRTSAGGTCYFGITRNDTAISSAPSGKVSTDVLLNLDTANAGQEVYMDTSWSGKLQQGDIIRLNSDYLTWDATTSWTISGRVNHQGVVKEGNPYDANETWLNVYSDGTILDSRFGNIDSNTTNEGIVTSRIATGRFKLDYSSLGLTTAPTVSVSGFQNGSSYPPRSGFETITATEAVYRLTGDSVYGYANFSATVILKKNYPDSDNSRDLLIPNHVTRLNGQEYPVMGEYVELADGTRYQVYRRAYIGAVNGTTYSLPNTVKLIGWVNQTSDRDIYRTTIYLGAGTSASGLQLQYDKGTELVTVIASSYDMPDTPLVIDYYDTARPY